MRCLDVRWGWDEDSCRGTVSTGACCGKAGAVLRKSETGSDEPVEEGGMECNERGPTAAEATDR